MYTPEDIKKVAIYCASSTKIDTAYFEAADRLGALLAEHRLEMVFGAGSMGLMGRLADSTIAHHGKMTGVIPQFMVDLDWHHPGCTELVVTKDMADRKTTIWQMSDAYVALPGGIGTLDEISEVLVLKQLGIITGPVVLLNTNGYYERLKQMLQAMIDERFMGASYAEMYTIVDTPEEVIPALFNQKHWSEDSRKNAKL